MKIDKKIVLGFVAITLMIIAVTATSFVSFNNFVKLFNQTQEKIQLAKFTTEKEIDFVLQKLPGIIEKLRRMSPFK